MAETHAERAARVFGSEIAQINDQRVKDFIPKCFNTICPDYFWKRPASRGGFYHPGFAAGPGGLVRHTKYVCYWFGRFSRAFLGNGENDDVGDKLVFDCGMAACIMHDMVKDGDEKRVLTKSKHKIARYHGVEMAEAIMDRVIKPAAPEEWQLLIMYAIASHMGVWTEPHEFRPWNIPGSLARKLATVVHMSDYAAAQQVDKVIPALQGIAV